MKLFDAASTATLLPLDPLVDALAEAMRERRQGRIHAPPRAVLPLPEGGTYLAMSAADDTLALSKLVSVTPANRARGWPTLHGTVIVSDARSGVPLCALDGPTVTAHRTAALTLLGVEKLLGRAARRVAIVGTGVQARAHAEAASQRWSPERLWVIGRTASSATAFVDDLARCGVDARAVPLDDALDDALADCDVVMCLTTSRMPVLPPRLPASTLVVGVGAFTPAMAEIAPEMARERRVVVDDLHGARDEAGDLLQAGIDWALVRELADCLDVLPPAPKGFVLKTVGHASWDLAAARVAVRQPGFARPDG